MIEAVRTELCACWGELLGSAPVDSKLSVVQLGGTGKRGGRVHFGALDEHGEPILFARVMRNPADEHLLEREYELLKTLGDGDALGDRVPAQCTIKTIDGQTVLIERAAAGPLMSEELRPALTSNATFERHLALAADLLGELAAATRRAVDEQTFVEERINPLRECWDEARGDADEFESVVETLLRALDGNYPSVLVHSDFNPNNLVLRPDGSCCALDWENASRDGLPLIDLFYFMSRYAYLGGLSVRLKNSERVSAFYRSNGKAARAGRHAVERYCERIELSRDAVGPLFQLHFLYKGWLKWRTSGVDGNKTRLWLSMFRDHVLNPRGPWR